MKKSNNYVDSKELDAEMVKYAESKVVSDRLAQILITLHDHILTHKNFRGYRQDLKDEMKSYSLYRLLKRGLNTWKPDVGSKAFSYLTRAIFCNFITVIKKYYNKVNYHREYIKNELMRINPSEMRYLEKFINDFKVECDEGVIMGLENDK